MARPLKIVLLGTRGIPAAYGGFETFAEELSIRLVQRGHDVTVFCRRFLGTGRGGETGGAERYKGVKLEYALTVRHKYLETPLHAFFSNLKMMGTSFDVALLCNAANSPFAWMIKLWGVPLAINVDGIERERAKWNSLGRLWYKIGEHASVLFASRVVSDAKVIQQYYREKFNCESAMIPYGAHAIYRPAGAVLEKFDLIPKEYLLYVSRLEPENNALGVIEAFTRIDTTLKLVIVGDAPYAEKYKESLYRAANDRVVFTGFQFGEAYQELQSNCLLYIQATEVGGTHPALIEAMSYGNCVIANGTGENIEVLGDAGVVYDKNDFIDLSKKMEALIEDGELRQVYSIRAKERARSLYDWESVTDAYEKLFIELSPRNS